MEQIPLKNAAERLRITPRQLRRLIARWHIHVTRGADWISARDLARLAERPRRVAKETKDGR